MSLEGDDSSAADFGQGGYLSGSVTFARSERRVFGLAPPEFVFALALLALVVAVYLLASRSWLAGAVLLVLAVLLGRFFFYAAGRLPDGRLARMALGARAGIRSRAEMVWVLLASWSQVMQRRISARVVSRRLRREQRRLLGELGEAVFAGELERAHGLKTEARALDQRIEECSLDVRRARETAHERVGRERIAAQPTQALPPSPSDAETKAKHPRNTGNDTG